MSSSIFYDSDDVYSSEDEDCENINYEENENCIKEDYEVVITQSKNNDIISNKKIQNIKENLNLILSTCFSHHEIVVINSIYNFNPDCLKTRSKFLQELIPVNMYLEHIGVKIPKELYTMVYKKIPNIFKKKTYSNIEKKIKDKFTFTEINKKNEFTDYCDKLLEIRQYCAGVVFCIKNYLILHTENNGEVLDILMENRSSLFVDDKSLQYFIDWLFTLTLNILLFQLKNKMIKKNNFIFKNKNSIEYFTTCSIKLILEMLLDVNKKTKDHVLIFLFMYDKKNIMKKLVKNELFLNVVKLVQNSFSKIETQKKIILYLSECVEKNINKSFEEHL